MDQKVYNFTVQPNLSKLTFNHGIKIKYLHINVDTAISEYCINAC